MSDGSKIEWTDHTFNPWIGCTRVSPGCDHCYASAQNDFRKWNPGGWQPGAPRKKTKTWGEPRKWQRQAKEFFETHGRRQRVFCASLADVMDNQVPTDWRVELWNLIRDCPDLDWQLLTKRPQNIEAMLPRDWGAGWSHVWLGTTAENQTELERRLLHLKSIRAHLLFLSAEPLLSPLDIEAAYRKIGGAAVEQQVGWVICGGESGPNARPMHPAWPRWLREQCADAGIPFFFKQWGEWGEPIANDENRHLVNPDGQHGRWESEFLGLTGCVLMSRVGKKAAGRLLDGVEYSEFPA